MIQIYKIHVAIQVQKKKYIEKKVTLKKNLPINIGDLVLKEKLLLPNNESEKLKKHCVQNYLRFLIEVTI